MHTQSMFTNLYFNFPLKSEKDLYKQIFPEPQARRVLDYKKKHYSILLFYCFRTQTNDNFLMLNWMRTYFENISGASLSDKSYTKEKNYQKISENSARDMYAAGKSVRNISKLQRAS